MLEQIVVGARALNGFFAQIINERTDDVIFESEKYEKGLTQNQRWYLSDVADRAQVARDAVRYLEETYKVDSEGRFADAKGAYEALCPAESAPADLTAWSSGIVVGFSTKTYSRKTLAHTYTHLFKDPLTRSSDELISAIKNGEDTEQHILSFYMPDNKKFEKICENSIRNKNSRTKLLLEAVFGETVFNPVENGDKLRKEAVNHEIRHTIDSILLRNDYFFEETPAHLYSHNWRPGLRRDYASVFKEIDDDIAKKKEYLTTQSNESIRKCVEGAIQSLEKRKRNVENQQLFFHKAILELMKPIGLENLSFIFSTFSRHRLIKVLDGMVEYYGRDLK